MSLPLLPRVGKIPTVHKGSVRQANRPILVLSNKPLGIGTVRKCSPARTARLARVLAVPPQNKGQCEGLKPLIWAFIRVSWRCEFRQHKRQTGHSDATVPVPDALKFGGGLALAPVGRGVTGAGRAVQFGRYVDRSAADLNAALPGSKPGLADGNRVGTA